MAVEVAQSDSRQIVQITWDKSILDGEIVQLFCANPENGDISQSGLSANDGKGSVSYPEGYSGTTEITVFDNHGNSDFGVITVGDGEVTQPEPPVEPTVPVDPNYGIDVDFPRRAARAAGRSRLGHRGGSASAAPDAPDRLPARDQPALTRSNPH